MAAPIQETAWLSRLPASPGPRAVILNFHGLGHTGTKTGGDADELEWENAGALVVFPYYGPWSWMNRAARAFIDELIAAIYRDYKLSDSVPLIIHGGSMGGLSALIYTRYSKHRIAACCALFPVCDLKYHFSERPDLPKTIHHAFRGYPEPMETLFAEHSPTAQAAAMPDIPYLLIHGDADTAVNKQAHSDRFAAAMRQAGRNITYLEVPGMGHGANTPYAIHRARIDWINQFIGK